MGGSRLPTLPSTCLPAPIPPTPFPAGRGRLFTLFRRGLAPPAPLRLNPGGAGFSFGKQCPKGDLSPGLSAGSAVPAPEGGLVFRLACLPCHLFTVFPPSPRPPSQREGGEQGYFMQGASPLASPGLNPGGTGFSFGKQCPKGACPRGCRLALLYRRPRGGLSFASPAYHAICLPFLPPSPRPPSRREGGDQGYFMQGASPLASPRLNPGGTGFSCGK